MGKTFPTASPPPRAHPTLSSLSPNSLDCVRSPSPCPLSRVGDHREEEEAQAPLPSFPPPEPRLRDWERSGVESKSVDYEGRRSRQQRKLSAVEAAAAAAGRGEIRGGCGGKRPPTGNCALLRGGEKKIRCFFPPLSSHPGQSSYSPPCCTQGPAAQTLIRAEA